MRSEFFSQLKYLEKKKIFFKSRIGKEKKKIRCEFSLKFWEKKNFFLKAELERIFLGLTLRKIFFKFLKIQTQTPGKIKITSTIVTQ